MDQRHIGRQAVHALAKRAALRAVKREIQKEGRVKVTLIPKGMLDVRNAQVIRGVFVRHSGLTNLTLNQCGAIPCFIQ